MKLIVLTEKPADGLPPLLIMGVAEESQMADVQTWVGNNERRGYVFTEKFQAE